MQIEPLLTKYFCELNQIDTKKDYTIEYVDPIELLVPERIDLIAKYKYIEAIDKGYEVSFFEELYSKHIEAFSFGECKEAGNPDKISLQDYITTFRSLMEDLKRNGINPDISVIPVGRNNVIMNGSHRVAIALYYGLKVPIVRFEQLYTDFGITFFQKRRLEEKYLEYLMLEYIKLKPNIYIACLYPAAQGQENLEKAIGYMNTSASILYQKAITFTSDGLRTLITQLYDSAYNPWIGTIDNHYAGSYHKMQLCNGSEPARFFVLSCDTLDTIKQLKRDIRHIYNVENNSIHITDTKQEAISLAQIIFNENTLHCYNYGKPDYYIEFNKKLVKFKEAVIKYKFSLEDFIIDSSSVMGLYALRDIRDIDFLTTVKDYQLIEDSIIGCHHKYLPYYNLTAENLIYNPDHYLVYNGIKFITIEQCIIFKKNRGEAKDKHDIRLISDIQKMGKMKILKRTIIWFENKKRALYYKYIFLHKNKTFRVLKGILKALLRKLHIIKKEF